MPTTRGRQQSGNTRSRVRTNRVSLPGPRTRPVNPTLPPGICRVDQASTRTFGYVVRVGHRRTPRGWRPKFKAYFGDVTYGGKHGALTAAVKWLRTLGRTGKPPARK
jgi:hypothetical protein